MSIQKQLEKSVQEGLQPVIVPYPDPTALHDMQYPGLFPEALLWRDGEVQALIVRVLPFNKVEVVTLRSEAAPSEIMDADYIMENFAVCDKPISDYFPVAMKPAGYIQQIVGFDNESLSVEIRDPHKDEYRQVPLHILYKEYRFGGRYVARTAYAYMKDNVWKQDLKYKHLPPHLQRISKIFADAAEEASMSMIPGPHADECFKLLVQAKDVAVRSALNAARMRKS